MFKVAGFGGVVLFAMVAWLAWKALPAVISGAFELWMQSVQ